jgi:hypothetical protein
MPDFTAALSAELSTEVKTGEFAAAWNCVSDGLA